MNIKKKKTRKKIGLPPGSLVYVGHHQHVPLSIEHFTYNELQFKDKKYSDTSFLEKIKIVPPDIQWINVNGIAHVQTLEKIGKHFLLHQLTLEDILNTEQRPKIEEYEDYTFFTLKMLFYDQETLHIEDEQVSFIMSPNLVISFQEKEGDLFDPIRDRIRNSKGRVRFMGADYLIYTLLDVILDNYFQIIEQIGMVNEKIEEEIFQTSSQNCMEKIQLNKRNILTIRKSIYPLREAIYKLSNDRVKWIEEKNRTYYRDLYDHTIQLVDNIETLRDINSGVKDMYMSSISLKMNKIMQTLTVISTIFIPLTFIAGVYGMNFSNMPELNWTYGYFYVLAVMMIIVAIMLFLFKKQKWF
jgi:magnesium transporter